MLEQLNERLVIVKERQRKKVKWERELASYENELKTEQEKAKQCKEQLQLEEKDVEKLEGLSLSNLFHTLLLNKDEQLKREKQEALAAKLKYDTAVAAVSDIQEEIDQLKDHLASVRGVDDEYREILEEKAGLIRDQQSSLSEDLYALYEQEAEHKADLKELDEALQAGCSLIGALDRAVHSLKKAEGWGTWDMIGGGMMSTAMKHSHIDDARSHVHAAESKLRRFSKELDDLNTELAVDLDFSGLLTFADYFFDGLITDWVVQGKISDSLQQVNTQHNRVSNLLNQLRQQKKTTEQAIRQTRNRRINLLERV